MFLCVVYNKFVVKHVLTGNSKKTKFKLIKDCFKKVQYQQLITKFNCCNKLIFPSKKNYSFYEISSHEQIVSITTSLVSFLHCF